MNIGSWGIFKYNLYYVCRDTQEVLYNVLFRGILLPISQASAWYSCTRFLSSPVEKRAPFFLLERFQ